MPAAPSSKEVSAVGIAVDVFLRHPGVGMDCILYALTQRGLDPAVAWRLSQFVPIAFCHVLFRGRGVTFTPTFISWNSESNTRVSKPLSEEPLYVAAVAAAEGYAGANSRGFLGQIAFYSAELDVIRKLASEGGDPDGIALTEPLIREYDPRFFIEWDDEVNRFLLAAFASHGTSPSLEQGWLVFPDESVRVNGLVYTPSRQGDRVVVRLDVRVCLDAESLMIVESFGGVGATESAAIGDAYRKFLRGTLHVILSAVLRRDAGEQVIREDWVVGGLPKVATIGGSVVVARSSEVLAELSADLRWFGRLEREIRNLGVGPGTHWIRLFYGQWDNRTQTLEVLLDNATWEPVQESMARAEWLPRPEFYSLRLFLILRDR